MDEALVWDALNGTLLAIVAVCSFYTAPGERPFMTRAAKLLVLNWLQFVLAFTPYSLSENLWQSGIQVSYQMLWEFADFACGIYCLFFLIHRFCWEAMTLYLLFAEQLVSHALRWELELLEAGAYYRFLDVTFWGQSAVFLLSGGKGIGAIIGAGARRAGDALRAGGTAAPCPHERS
jgi:hypothetical protein